MWTYGFNAFGDGNALQKITIVKRTLSNFFERFWKLNVVQGLTFRKRKFTNWFQTIAKIQSFNGTAPKNAIFNSFKRIVELNNSEIFTFEKRTFANCSNGVRDNYTCKSCTFWERIFFNFFSKYSGSSSMNLYLEIASISVKVKLFSLNLISLFIFS